MPATVADATLRDAAQFRSRGRIPVLSWRCAATGVCLARAAQPKSGTTKRRSRADEDLVAAIFEAGAQPSRLSLVLPIELRPFDGRGFVAMNE